MASLSLPVDLILSEAIENKIKIVQELHGYKFYIIREKLALLLKNML